ncbi:tyrosine-type recombinase/integrase [Nonomuraea sp. B19D2]|uniref:tyrosine-type recombinase/integrase n=1 Tax=Nonomuraea sp. B19D2 TaxID=3159561 RepID=UPI0032DB26CD
MVVGPRQRGHQDPQSRRTLQLPHCCVHHTLIAFWDHLNTRGIAPSQDDQAHVVFATRNGTKMSAGNVRREFRRVITRAGLVGTDWTPREMRHSFVSLLSADGVPIENIARLIGHRIFPGNDHGAGQSPG